MKKEPEDGWLSWHRYLIVSATCLWLGIWLSQVSRSLGIDDWVPTRCLVALAGTMFAAHILRKGLFGKE